jgi:AcrR family transcriptional regulator
VGERRAYESPLRRRRADETRERIIAAGASILHEHAVWDWNALTVRAVAGRAGVSERTVYRHVENERTLRDAVLDRLATEAGVELESLAVGDLQGSARRLLGYVSAFPLQSRTPLDPTLIEAGRRKRDALLAAVDRATPDWSERDRRFTAAIVDVLWSVGTQERLITEWGLDVNEAVDAAVWAVALVEREIAAGHRPTS